MTDFNVEPIDITGKKKTNVYHERELCERTKIVLLFCLERIQHESIFKRLRNNRKEH